MKTRYAFAVLAMLSLAVGATSILFTVSVEHKFCSVVTAFTATPVQAPAHPKAEPARESQFEWYQRFLSLGQSLGC